MNFSTGSRAFMSPVEFYRELDQILAKIAKIEEKKEYLFSIIHELENAFSAKLHFTNGLLYEEGANRFYLVHANSPASGHLPAPELIPFENPALQRVIKHGCYIYDQPDLTLIPQKNSDTYYAIPAAILVHGSELRWLIVFELVAGWQREEIEFCFNMVRRALEFQITSKAFQNSLLAAAHIQQSLLPRKPPEIPGFQIAAVSNPAEVVGGDLYDFFEFDGTFGVAIGDAVGHDLPAALLVRDVVTGLRMGIEKEMKITYAIRKLNRVIHRSTFSSAYVSLFYSEIEENGSLFYINAGHPAPLLVNGPISDLLEATGPLIGPLPEIAIKRGYSYLAPGAVLLLYTDGIFERRNKLGESFSIGRLRELVSLNQSKSAKEILTVLLDAAFHFGGSLPWEDDVSLVLIKREG